MHVPSVTRQSAMDICHLTSTAEDERRLPQRRQRGQHTTRQNAGATSVPLTELPFGLPGHIFRSPMPFGTYDPHGEVYASFLHEQIAVVVLLADENECLHKAGRNLRAFYLQEGLTVLYLPIPDFGVPTKDDLEQAVQHTMTYAQAGHHIAIHCAAGIGRTGLFAAYLAKRFLGLSGGEALQWIRQYIPHALETPAQQRLLLEDE